MLLVLDTMEVCRKLNNNYHLAINNTNINTGSRWIVAHLMLFMLLNENENLKWKPNIGKR